MNDLSRDRPGASQAFPSSSVNPRFDLAPLYAAKLIMSRKWLVLSGTAIALAFAIIALSTMTPIYRSTATVLIETSKNSVVSIDQIVSAATANREYFETQAEFLRSRNVAIRVVQNLDLSNHPVFVPKPDLSLLEKARALTQKSWKSLQQMMGISEQAPKKELTTEISSTAQVATETNEDAATSGSKSTEDGSDSRGTFAPISNVEPNTADVEAESKIAVSLRASLRVQPVRLSQLITVSFDSPDPILSAEVANAVAESYIRSDLDARFEVTQKAMSWLNERLEQIRLRLQTSEANLLVAREKAGIVSDPGTSFSGSIRQMTAASDRLVQARVARAQAQQVYRQVRKGAANRYSVPQVFNNPSVIRARELMSVAQRALEEVKQRFGVSHPRYVRTEAEYVSARQNYISQAESVVSSIAKQYEVARSTERAVKQEIEAAQLSMKNIDRKGLSIEAAEREVNTTRQLYQTFLARVKETAATSDFQSPVARVIDPAIPAATPIKPSKTLFLPGAALIGFLLSAAFAYLHERMNKRVRSSDDVAEELNQPLLSVIPSEKSLTHRSLLRSLSQLNGTLFGESIRTAVTSVQLSVMNVKVPVVGFCSAIAGEGKSTVAIAFALDVARRKRVLLIDADLRRPNVSKRLELDESKPGLTDFLNSTHSIKDVIQFLPQANLSVIGAGTRDKNPLDLLMADEFEHVLNGLKERYDFIVIDAPPVGLVSDALVIGRQCTGIVFLVNSDSTEIPMIRRALDRIWAAGVSIFGVALNNHDFVRATRFHDDSSAYGKYSYTYGHETEAVK